MKPHPARLELGNYPHKAIVPTRFADLDPLWHLNNVRIAEIYQEARVSFNFSLDRRHHFADSKEHRILVARQSIDYIGEVKWPQPITVGVGVSRVGGTSFSLGMAMFQEAKCVGISDVVLVHATIRGPQALPASWREVLSKRMLTQAEAPL